MDVLRASQRSQIGLLDKYLIGGLARILIVVEMAHRLRIVP